MSKTLTQYDHELNLCRNLFLKKTQDYGTAWRILRATSLTDQLFIKARRIRQIEETQHQKIADKIEDEYRGLINYSLMALIQLTAEKEMPVQLTGETALELYNKNAENVRWLMIEKNADYGEAWRDMRVSSFTDLILMKILRIKQIEDNSGATLVSEGVSANYHDIINYAIFALIKLNDL